MKLPCVRVFLLWVKMPIFYRYCLQIGHISFMHDNYTVSSG